MKRHGRERGRGGSGIDTGGNTEKRVWERYARDHGSERERGRDHGRQKMGGRIETRVYDVCYVMWCSVSRYRPEYLDTTRYKELRGVRRSFRSAER